jgi:hypothetical protein
MPRLNIPAEAFKPQRTVEANYRGFNGGLNNFFQDTEIKRNELSYADNTMLIGQGVVTGRWGSDKLFLAGNGYVRFLGEYENIQTNTQDLLAITDSGFLVKKSGTSNTIITGASFASGSISDGVQLGNNMYIVSENTNFSRYNGTNLTLYSGVSIPTISGVSRLSGATGLTTWSYRLTSISTSGETTPSTAVTLSNLPADLTTTTLRVSWSQVSAASGLLKGYALYRGLAGEETLIAQLPPTETTYIDVGTPQSDTIFPPATNTTIGVKAKYIKRFEDRLVIAGIDGDPTMVMISGKYPYQDRFSWQYGGGYVRIAPDSGDEITGIEVAGTTSIGASTSAAILVFMKEKVFQLVLTTIELGNYIVLNPIYQEIAPVGNVNQNAVVNIKNNTFYFNREGIQTVGVEAAYLNQIRTRDISARVRGSINSLTDTQKESASGGFVDDKYFISFNDKSTIVYDYERAAFAGVWRTPFVITEWYRWVDNGTEKYLVGCDDGYVREFSKNYQTDSGTKIDKVLRTRREDFDRFNLMKTLQTFYLLFRNIIGTVNVNLIIEDKNGLRTIVKTITIDKALGDTGWGTNLWGVKKWGQTKNLATLFLADIVRWGYLYKSARTLLLEVTTNTTTSNFELVNFIATAQYQPEGSLPAKYRV